MSREASEVAENVKAASAGASAGKPTEAITNAFNASAKPLVSKDFAATMQLKSSVIKAWSKEFSVLLNPYDPGIILEINIRYEHERISFQIKTDRLALKKKGKELPNWNDTDGFRLSPDLDSPYIKEIKSYQHMWLSFELGCPGNTTSKKVMTALFERIGKHFEPIDDTVLEEVLKMFVSTDDLIYQEKIDRSYRSY